MIEIVTRQLPFLGINNMDVVQMVCYQNKHHAIPSDCDPIFSKIILVNSVFAYSHSSSVVLHETPMIESSFQVLLKSLRISILYKK